MFELRLLPTFLLFLFLFGGQVLLVAKQAYGQYCCACPFCMKLECINCCDECWAFGVLEDFIEKDKFIFKTELGDPVPVLGDPRVFATLKELGIGKGSHGLFNMRLIGDAKGLRLTCTAVRLLETPEKRKSAAQEYKDQTEEFTSFTKLISKRTGRKPK